MERLSCGIRVFGNNDTETGKNSEKSEKLEKLEKFRWKFRFL